MAISFIDEDFPWQNINIHNPVMAIDINAIIEHHFYQSIILHFIDSRLHLTMTLLKLFLSSK